MPTYASKRIYLLWYRHSLVVHVNDLHVEGVDGGEDIGGPLHHNLPAGVVIVNSLPSQTTNQSKLTN